MMCGIFMQRFGSSPPTPDCSPIANSTTRSASASWGGRSSPTDAPARTGVNSLGWIVSEFQLFGRLAGYEDVKDAGRLGLVRRCVGLSVASWPHKVAQAGRRRRPIGRFETKWLAAEILPGKRIDRVRARRPHRGAFARHQFEH